MKTLGLKMHARADFRCRLLEGIKNRAADVIWFSSVTRIARAPCMRLRAFRCQGVLVLIVYLQEITKIKFRNARKDENREGRGGLPWLDEALREGQRDARSGT